MLNSLLTILRSTVNIHFLWLFVCLQCTVITAQCTDTYIKVLGKPASNERGYAIVSSPTSKVVYVSATKADSLIIIKFDSLGQLLWSRRLEIETNRAESVNGMILDSEGKLAIAGTIGNIDQQGDFFVCRYDPDANIVLWANRLISHSEGFASGISEMGPGGDYLIYNNPTDTNDAELLLLDKITGDIDTDFASHYHVGNAETISDMILHNNVLYGIGRFTDGNDFADMRTAVFSLDPMNGNVIWSKLGHRPANVSARLYGVDMVIVGEHIYGLTCGDDNGAGINNTEMYIQKLGLDGTVDWVKRYDLPGANDWVDEIIEFEGGLIIMARNRVAPSNIILIKTDYDGNVLWSKRYDFATNDNSVSLGGITSQLTSLEGHLYFTAFADNGSMTDLLLVRTDRDGNITGDCQNATPVNVTVSNVSNPVFYDVEVSVSQFVPARVALPVNTGVPFDLNEQLVCGTPAPIQQLITQTICEGESHEGYTQPGTYEDQFVSANGCDSIRTLHLQVIPCQVECGQFSASIYGVTGTGEHGQCLVPTPENDGVYLAANKEDSTLLVKIDLQGNWIWTKTIDAVKNDHEIPAGILVDADGMIAISGTARNPVNGGSLYAIRYDPVNHQILWAREYNHSPRDFNFDIEEKGNGGNYLLVGQATFNNGAYNDACIAEIDKISGALIPEVQKNYHLNGTETLYEIIYHNDYVYGVGRYKDAGPINQQMRHTLVKLDPGNGDQVWVKMGHQPPTNEARLYGTDMVIDNDIIMSLYHGDPAGHSTTTTEAYIQRTDIDGNLIWTYRYDIPGNNPFGYELIKSGNGYIAYTTEVSTGEHFLFKIDDQGNVLWAKKIVFFAGADIFYAQRGNQLLVQAGNKLVMTGAVVNGSGDADLFIIMTDLDGNLSSPCVETITVPVTRHSVPNPVFYDVAPELIIADTMSSVLFPLLLNSMVPAYPECDVQDTIFTEETVTICEGTEYNGYTASGDYSASFIAVNGCDSLHTLHLIVVPCESPCFDTLTSVYGEPGVRENGLCIEAAPNGDGYYILGRRADGVLLLKFSAQDQLLWTQRIDAVANKREYPCDFIIDSDGMIAVTGMATDNPSVGGTIFIFRFNPATQSLLWSREIPSAYDHDRVHALSQNGPGGNYLISTNPNEVDGAIHNDFQIIEINPVNGIPNPQSHIKKLGNSNYIFDLHREGDFLYGTGRFSLGVGNDLLRHTIVKLDATTFNTIWTKLSHTPQDVDTRIYGFDMVIDNGFIYSGVYGDPDGTSTAQTEIFVQKTTIDGELIWFKEYDLPLNTDFGYELIKSGNGFVIFANQRNAMGELYLFKIDSDGNVLWAREYETSRNSNTVTFAIGGEQLIALGSDLVFTASVDDIGGAEDILVLHLDSLGFTDAPCVTVKTFSLQAEDEPAIVYDSIVQEFNWLVTSQAQPLAQESVTLLPALGCSQSITPMSAIDTTICQGDSFESYTQPGTYQDTFQTAVGCDSIRTIILSVTMESITLDIQICEGVDYEGYSTTGMYVDTLSGSNGECDTIRYLDLDVIQAPLTHINATFCEGESFLGYSETGIYADTFSNVDGCDSIRTLNLTILPVVTAEELAWICEGTNYLGYDATGVYVDTLVAVNGCDSIRNLVLTVLPPVTTEVNNTICEGETYLGYSTTGIYPDTFITDAGCDSVRVLMLTVNPAAMTSQAQSICAGDVFEGYETTGTYVDTFISVTGCDSIRTLSLSVGYMTAHVAMSICEGESYEGYALTGIYIDTLTGVASACDTLRTLDLTVINIVQSTIDQVICDDESFEGYNSSGVYVDTLISSSGCDSIRELHLEKLPPIETTILANVCDPATPANLPVGTHTDTLVSIRGCDSLRILTVVGTSLYIPNVFSPNDDGINDVFIVHPYPTDSLDLEYFAIFDRFGDMTYETRQWPITWKGDDADGKPFQPGVFAYVLIYHCGTRRIIEHGDITLVK
jgi:gliding motility-associated-like protein